MPKKGSKVRPAGTDSCCASDCCDASCSCRGVNVLDCCRVEAVVNVDARGQMVLPKELREKAGIAPDQKLAVLSWMKGNDLCCITLQKADDLAEVVRRTYGPLLSTAVRPR
jgi:antitoxin PrlF